MSNLDVIGLEPNVYLTETPSPAEPKAVVATGVGAMFGITDWGVEDVPVLCTSLSAWVKEFKASTGYTSYTQVRKFFQNGGKNLWFKRITHYATITDNTTGTGVKATGSLMDDNASPVEKYKVTARCVGAFGNTIKVVISAASNADPASFNLTVTDSAGIPLEPTFNNLNEIVGDSYNLMTVINNKSLFIKLSAGLGVDNLDQTQADVTMSSGEDGVVGIVAADYTGDTEALTGFHAFDNIPSPLVTFSPDMSSNAVVVNALLDWTKTPEGAVNFIICTGDEGIDEADITSFRTTSLGGVGTSGDNSKGALYYKYVVNQEDGSVISPLGAIAGVYSRTDSDVTKGVWFSPSGTHAVLKYVTGLESSISAKAIGRLNALGINCLKDIPDIGVCPWGSRTLAITEKQDYLYINARRNTSDLEARVLARTLWAVHRPNGPKLWHDIKSVVNQILNTRYLEGGLDGDTTDKAYSVKVDSDINGQAEKDAGIVRCLLGINNLGTAEFVWFDVTPKVG